MNVRELIELLKTLPPELPVGHINRCADDGVDFSEVGCAEVTGYGAYGGKAWAPDGMPAECIVLE